MPIFHQPELTHPLVALQHPRAQPGCWSRAPGAAFPSSQSDLCCLRSSSRNQTPAQPPAPGRGTGHTQLTGQEFGWDLLTATLERVTLPWHGKQGLWLGLCPGLKVSLAFLSDKQAPFGLNPSALI